MINGKQLFVFLDTKSENNVAMYPNILIRVFIQKMFFENLYMRTVQQG